MNTHTEKSDSFKAQKLGWFENARLICKKFRKQREHDVSAGVN